MTTQTAVETVPETSCSCCGTPYADTELVHAPEPTDYGLLEFALVDPHGNLVRIGGRLDGTA